MSFSSASMAQLNVRMSPELKRKGDAILDRMGITPAQFVRAVWEKVGLGEKAVEQLLRTLAMRPAVGEVGHEHSLSLEVLETNSRSREAFYSEMEANFGPPPPPLSEEEMQDYLYEESLERDRERLIDHAL